jgi:hypothetical protein
VHRSRSRLGPIPPEKHQLYLLTSQDFDYSLKPASVSFREKAKTYYSVTDQSIMIKLSGEVSIVFLVVSYYHVTVFMN